jgi:hypothetical protein
MNETKEKRETQMQVPTFLKGEMQILIGWKQYGFFTTVASPYLGRSLSTSSWFPSHHSSTFNTPHLVPLLTPTPRVILAVKWTLSYIQTLYKSYFLMMLILCIILDPL